MRIAIVTGASSGIGMEFAKYLALSKGDSLDEIWLVARRREKLDTVVCSVEGIKNNSCRCEALQVDLRDANELLRFKEKLDSMKPQVSYLVNAAGMGKFTSAMNMSADEIMNTIELNVTALTLLTKYVWPYMDKGSVIINMGSRSAFQPVPYINVYAATKAYVLSFSRALSEELRSFGIRVICVCPYWVRSEFIGIARDGYSDVSKLGRMFEAKDVVEKAFYDIERGKDVSILGIGTKAETLLSKLLPHKLVMRIWEKKQGK